MMMAILLRRLSSSLLSQSPLAATTQPYQLEWTRGIRVRVYDDNLDSALSVMERKMRSSGIERLIKQRTERHLKNSEKRVLARKNLQMRVRSQELARKLRTIISSKLKGF